MLLLCLTEINNISFCSYWWQSYKTELLKCPSYGCQLFESSLLIVLIAVCLALRWLMNSPDLGVLSAIDLSRLVCTLHGVYAGCAAHLSFITSPQLISFDLISSLLILFDLTCSFQILLFFLFYRMTHNILNSRNVPWRNPPHHNRCNICIGQESVQEVLADITDPPDRERHGESLYNWRHITSPAWRNW